MQTPAALLEREEELATIERALNAAAQGEGGPLTIEGEAGAGKTTLLGAAAGLAEERGMRVLRARGGEYERDFPYGVVRQLFEPLLVDAARREELLGSAAAAIFEPRSAPSGGADPFDVLHGLHTLVAGLAASSALALLVDDAQWADLHSLRALSYIGRRLEGLPAALALAVRSGEPGEHEPLLEELRREDGARTVEPSALTAAAAAELVEAEVGLRPAERFAAACREATAGNPFLLGELLRALDPGELETGEADPGRLAEAAAAGASWTILARLGRLGEDAAAVARAVAVLEPNARARPVAELAGLPAEAVAASCERLVLACLLSDSRPVAFAHPLVREAVLGQMPAPRRAAEHGRAARLLGEDGASVDTVGAHLLLAEPVGDGWAVERLRAAAADALGRGAPDAAVRYLRRALREPPASADRLAVSRELGLALLRADDPEGTEVLRGVRTTLDDPHARAEIAAQLAIPLGFRRSGEEAAALLEESMAEVGGDGDMGLYLRALLLLQTFYGLQRVPGAAAAGPEDWPDGSSLPGRLFLRVLAFLHAVGWGPVERAPELAERAGLDAAGYEADVLAGFPAHYVLGALGLADRDERPRELLAVAIEASRRRGAMPGVAGGHGMRAFCNLLDGELEAARADAETAVRLMRPASLRVQMVTLASVALKVMLAQGDAAGAERLLDDLWRGREPGPGFPGALLLVARGELRAAGGGHAEARHDFLAAAERLRWLPCANPEILGWRTGLARAEAVLGSDEEARRLAAEAVRLAREAGGRRGIGIALRVQGTVVGGEEGLRLLGEAAEVLAGTRARLQHAEALAELGAALRRANRRREAREPLREALDLARRCGAGPLEERVRTELAATGARPRRTLLSGVESLTPSELRVARMAAEGMTNREIAQSLVVTPKTVETHMRHAFQKLEIDGRAELAAALSGERR